MVGSDVATKSVARSRAKFFSPKICSFRAGAESPTGSTRNLLGVVSDVATTT